VPANLICRPWSAAPLAGASVEPRKTCPLPVVDHKKGRERALAAYAKVRND
jgi:deoxyribodipyrimidine photo-lyase